MNTRQKGRNAEKEYKKLLMARGYKEEDIELVKGSSPFNKSVDLWRLWDLAAFSEDETHLLLAQIKSNTTGGAIKQAKEWKEKHKKLSEIGFLKIIVAVRKDGSGGKPATWREIEIL